jgi:hypothetical protein
MRSKKSQKVYQVSGVLFIVFSLFSCSNNTAELAENNAIHFLKYDIEKSSEIQKYWFNGQAEISSYELKQARYGEIRSGEAVTIFVSEPFSPSKMTKADRSYEDNVSVLKCNFTRRFNTGIYPYSVMTSTFFPFEKESHSIKATTSMQEWCGHVYMELRNKKEFELDVFSYFEGETVHTSMKKTALEDDFWTKIRLNPGAIETGTFKVIPSFTYICFSHIEPKAYACQVTKREDGELTLFYPELDRNLTIRYETTFPHLIQSWSEVYMDGSGVGRKKLETTGKRIKTIHSDYWNHNNNTDEYLRKELGLKL